MNDSTTSSNSCPKCGAALPSAATAGLCPRCLMAEAMAPTQADAEPAAARQTLAPAELAPFFPQLEILECLGRGGMGVVYKARQKSLNRFVALKLLAPERVRDTQFAERFTREAQALAALSHPNIVTIYDFGQAGGFYFLLMEFVDGVNLRQLLRLRKFTPEEALAIVPPLCDALQLAHNRGIVHRDIKPENLLLDKDGHVKVADFGIAKIMGSTDTAGKGGGASAPQNTTQTAVGTPNYSAPEQKTDPQRVDSRADIYSLGVVFYEMLTGELPGKRIEPPSRKVQIDVRLDEVVLRALESDPERRYQQASEVKTMVETIALESRKSEADQNQFMPAVTTPFGRMLVQIVMFGPVMLVACLVVLLGMSSEAIGAKTWSYFRLGFEILAASGFVGFLFVVYRAITTKTPEARQAVKSTVPWMIVMLLGILFGFWSPHLLLTKSDYISQQTKSADAGNYWAKFNLWEAFARGKHEVTKNSAKADQWLAELIKGTYLAKFEPVNGFNPTTPQAMLDQFSKQCGLFSGKESLGGASFFRTTQQDGKLIGSFLTELPDEFKAAVEKSSNFKLISIQKVTPDIFETYEASPQESLKESGSSTATTPASADQIAEGKGWNGFKLGATREELIKALGQPDSDSDNHWMKWKQAHVHCLVDDARSAFELRFDEGFPGLTTAGIGIGSHLKDALAAYGEPSSQKNVGSAKKVLWISKGILIWFHEDRAAQIVVFQKPDQPSTLTPPAGPVELKWKWPPAGERVVWDMNVKRNGEYLYPGQPDRQQEDLTLEKKYGLTVLQATPGGRHEVELEFLSIQNRIALGGETVLDYDSSQKSSASRTNSMTDLYGKVVGSKIRYFLNASNEVERMEGADELEQRLSSGASSNASTLSKLQFSEDNLKQMVTGLYCVLPPKAVQPGDTWQFQTEMAMGPLGTASIDHTVTFRNWEQHWKRNCARLEFQSTVKTIPEPNSNPAGTSVSSLEGASSGVAWFDPELGMVIETAANTDMKTVINRLINPGGNPGASGPPPGMIYQTHDADNATILQNYVLEGRIGVELRVDRENIIIQEIVPGLPAAAQKDIHVGDRIIAVAQDTGPAVPVQGGQLAQAVALIHGPAGTTVRLTLVSSGEDDSRARVVSFVRAELKTPSR